MEDNRIQLSVPFEVVCMNAANRPREIPTEKWLIKGRQYTVIGVGYTLNGKLGFKLEEIELRKDNYPFGCFSSMRFGLPPQDKMMTLEDELSALGIEVEKFERKVLEI